MHIAVEIDAHTIEQLHQEIQELYVRFGPDRSVGPVTFEFEEEGKVRILIGTQKQGNQAYEINEIGNLVEGQ